jgi:hypothetical protein
MAQGKKSFILYADYMATVSKLTDGQAGKLFKLILEYVNDKDPTIDNLLLQVAFEPIKQNLKRDLKEWEAERSKRSVAGKKGGIKSGETRRSRSKRSSASKNEANEAVSDNVTVNVNDTVKREESPASHFGLVVYDAEQEILNNSIQFEKICMSAGAEISNVKESLRKYHLYLEENHKYPKSKKAVFAGFEKWLMNEKKFNNGNQNGASGKNNTHRAVITGTATGAGPL